MEEAKTSVSANGLLWFGAAISIAEMLSGTFFSSLGVAKGILAIVLGHVIGGLLMFGSGMIGAKTTSPAMKTVERSFGKFGGKWFSSINVLQLLGWTAVMISSGAQACQLFLPMPTGFWMIIIGVLTAIWIAIGLTNLGKINSLAMFLLLIGCVYLTTLILSKDTISVATPQLSFGSALELAIAMPLSWLPLISDYTSKAKRPFKSTVVSVVIYNVASSWMYVIGMMGVLVTGKLEIASMMKVFCPGIMALVIIVLSTVTTTFLDVFSAGVSARAIHQRFSVKQIGLVVCLIGTVIAIVVPLSHYENFLYFIGSVFVPMIAIQLMDFFVYKRDFQVKKFDGFNSIIWVVGFVIYRIFLTMSTPVGSTIPVIVIVMILTFFVHLIRSEEHVSKISK